MLFRDQERYPMSRSSESWIEDMSMKNYKFKMVFTFIMIILALILTPSPNQRRDAVTSP